MQLMARRIVGLTSRCRGWRAAALVLAVAPVLPAHGDDLVAPSVPASIAVPAGNRPYLEGHAVGSQNYICLPSGAGFAWTLFGPQATLFNDGDRQILTHFLSANPHQAGTPRPTWQFSRDSSTVWGFAIGSSSDSGFVAPGAIPWLLLQVVGSDAGPTDGNRLGATSYIQRVDTMGGVAPPGGCTQASNVGTKALVPYTANCFFFRGDPGGDD